jgi:cell division protein FtsB
MSWLRWYDKHGNWILTSTEEERKKAEQERQKLEQERQKTERLIAQLRALGVEPDL